MCQPKQNIMSRSFFWHANSAFGVLVLEPVGWKWPLGSQVKDLWQNWISAPQPSAEHEQGIEKQPSLMDITDSVG